MYIQSKEQSIIILNMVSLTKIGPALGFGGRAHVFEATKTEGKLIALKPLSVFPPICHLSLLSMIDSPS